MHKLLIMFILLLLEFVIRRFQVGMAQRLSLRLGRPRTHHIQWDGAGDGHRSHRGVSTAHGRPLAIWGSGETRLILKKIANLGIRSWRQGNDHHRIP